MMAPVACQIITINALPEFIASTPGQSYYTFLNAVLEKLAFDTASCRAAMVDAKTILSIIPREDHEAIDRFNASCKFLKNVFDAMGAKDMNIPLLDAMYKANENFVASRNPLLMPGVPDKTAVIEAAADLLAVAGAARGLYKRVQFNRIVLPPKPEIGLPGVLRADRPAGT